MNNDTSLYMHILLIYAYEISSDLNSMQTTDEKQKKYKIRRVGCLCIHYRDKYTCVECKSKYVCMHNRIKNHCITCRGGRNKCIHGKIKYICKECGGKGLCIHDRQKNHCKECTKLCTRLCTKCKHVIKEDIPFATVCFDCTDTSKFDCIVN
jgi:hypothetical protein